MLPAHGGRSLPWLLLAWLTASPVCAQTPAVSKVEPPNWWAGHSINPVRVLLRGTALGGATVEGLGDGLSIGLTRANGSGTYLFVDVLIDPAAALDGGRCGSARRTGAVDVPFDLSAPLPRQNRFRGITEDDVVYLLMPDRFADGDPANDDPAVARGTVRSHPAPLLPRG